MLEPSGVHIVLVELHCVVRVWEVVFRKLVHRFLEHGVWGSKGHVVKAIAFLDFDLKLIFFHEIVSLANIVHGHDGG